MPAFNAGKHIAKAIKSILSQTLDDLELIVINDGSTDDSLDLIKSFDDPRIILIENQTNIGIIQSSNKGLKLARGQYIALMDADDISMPRRLEKQAYFLDTNHDVAACGSWARIFGNVFGVAKTPTDSEELAATFIFENMIINSSAMVRRDVLEKEKMKYRDDFPHAHDYDLWARLSLTHKLCNLDEILIKYRVHQAQDSQKSAKLQRESAIKIKKYLLKNIGIEPTPLELETHLAITTINSGSDISMKEVVEWLCRLRKTNSENKFFDPIRFDKILKHYQESFFVYKGKLSLSDFIACVSSPFSTKSGASLNILLLAKRLFLRAFIMFLKRVVNVSQ